MILTQTNPTIGFQAHQKTRELVIKLTQKIDLKKQLNIKSNEKFLFVLPVVLFFSNAYGQEALKKGHIFNSVVGNNI